MQKHTLPEFIDPVSMAKSHIHLEGDLAIETMSRLCSLIHSPKGQIRVSLTFEIDENKYSFIAIEIAADLELLCQRCLQPYMANIVIQSRLSPVFSDAECTKLPERYEPLLLTESTIKLATITEDEILLNLPLVPKHAQMCINLSQMETKDEAKQANPFEVLKKLKLK